MSAAFALEPTGPPLPCDFPGCTLEAYHDGEHLLERELSARERNERLAAAVTSYGLGTRSYNRSAEKREMNRQRAEATKQYEAAPHEQVEADLLCPCPQRPYAHELSIHKMLRPESYNPQRKHEWPWSLCLSERAELSTER